MPSILGGSALVSAAFLALPLSETFPQLMGVLVPLAVGSTILQSVPAALITDLAPPAQRAQAMAMYRTAGDVGLLLGGMAAGAIADAHSFSAAIHSGAALVGCSLSLFALRHYRGGGGGGGGPRKQ